MLYWSLFIVATAVLNGCKHTNDGVPTQLTSIAANVRFISAEWFSFAASIRPPLRTVDEAANDVTQTYLDLWQGNSRFANCYWDDPHAKWAFFEPSRALSTTARFVDNPTHWRVIRGPNHADSKKSWKPISSAPKQEGVLVDVWVVNKRFTDVKWHAKGKQWQQEVKTSALRYETSKIKGEPSHWMPVKAP